MSTKRNHKLSPGFTRFLPLLALSILFGLGWFLLLYGRYPLYFSNVNWIYESGGDVFQHHIGWEWFRQEPWRFPLGRIEAYGYPFGTSLSYLDSIPLFAIPFKVLSPLLGNHFQYLGLWELTSVILQMLVGMLILGEFTRSYPLRVLGASLLILSPPLIMRTFHHNSLTAQWILLAGIWFILLEYRRRLWRWAWPVLFGVSMLVHLYFAAMLLPLWAVSLYFSYRHERNIARAGLDILVVAGVLLLTGYSTGLFSLAAKNLELGGFGMYSWNLNELVNPLQVSAFFKELPTGTKGQYEGFSYLGLGNLLILPFSLFLFLQGDPARRLSSFFLPLVLAAILYVLYALSDKAFFGIIPLWDVNLPAPIQSLASLFRSSGRFIWPVYYLIVLFGLASVLRNYRWPALVLGLALVLQYIDLQPLVASKRFSGFAEYELPMQSEFWPEAAAASQHMVILPSGLRTKEVYKPLAIFSVQNGMTLNWGYFSRADYDAIEAYGERTWQDLLAGHADPQSIYLVWKNDMADQVRQNPPAGLLFCRVDGYDLLLSTESDLVKSGFDLSSYCSVP